VIVHVFAVPGAFVVGAAPDGHLEAGDLAPAVGDVFNLNSGAVGGGTLLEEVVDNVLVAPAGGGVGIRFAGTPAPSGGNQYLPYGPRRVVVRLGVNGGG
ncbi:MAG: hypothetical protein OXG89_08165, partial [bacterium]|nr:hypothetical protein [bacterium]